MVIPAVLMTATARSIKSDTMAGLFSEPDRDHVPGPWGRSLVAVLDGDLESDDLGRVPGVATGCDPAAFFELLEAGRDRVAPDYAGQDGDFLVCEGNAKVEVGAEKEGAGEMKGVVRQAVKQERLRCGVFLLPVGLLHAAED